jgi:hypothetical protein
MKSTRLEFISNYQLLLMKPFMTGDTVDAHDGDPKCGSFQDVGICVHEVFYDVRRKLDDHL